MEEMVSRPAVQTEVVHETEEPEVTAIAAETIQPTVVPATTSILSVTDQSDPMHDIELEAAEFLRDSQALLAEMEDHAAAEECEYCDFDSLDPLDTKPCAAPSCPPNSQGPTEPVGPVTQEVNPLREALVAEEVAGGTVAGTNDTAAAVEVTEPGKPLDYVESVQPTKPVEPMEPMEPVQPKDPMERIRALGRRLNDKDASAIVSSAAYSECPVVVPKAQGPSASSVSSVSSVSNVSNVTTQPATTQAATVPFNAMVTDTGRQSGPKPTLKLPGSKATSKQGPKQAGQKVQQPVQPGQASQALAQPPQQSLQTPQMVQTSPAAKHSVVDETQPMILNSMVETPPAQRIMHGLPSTKVTGNTSMPTSLSYPTEYNRQMELVTEDEARRDQRTQEIHRLHNQMHYAQPAQPDLARKFSDFIGLTKPVVELNTQEVQDKSAANLCAEQRRDLRVQLSKDDISMPEILRQTHQEWVKGTSLQDMRTMGIGPDELVGIGVSWSDWLNKQHYGVKELACMGGTWQHAVRMGLLPEDIVVKRDKCGPKVLSDTWGVTFNDLEWSLGVGVDEAVGSIGLTTADFAVLGETTGSLISKGFGQQHVELMKEPRSSFEIALQGTEQDLRFLFGNAEARQAEQAQRRTNQLQEVHVRTTKVSKGAMKRMSNKEFKF